MADWVGESKAAKSRAVESKAVGQARWLAELAEAVDEAQLLLWDLAAADTVSPEARALYGRIESVRVEIEALRGAGRADPGEILITEWLELLARTAQQSRPASGSWARRPGASHRRPKIR